MEAEKYHLQSQLNITNKRDLMSRHSKKPEKCLLYKQSSIETMSNKVDEFRKFLKLEDEVEFDQGHIYFNRETELKKAEIVRF